MNLTLSNAITFFQGYCEDHSDFYFREGWKLISAALAELDKSPLSGSDVEVPSPKVATQPSDNSKRCMQSRKEIKCHLNQ